MSKSLQVLAENRDALLLAEVAAWLHMIGKFQKDFLEDKYYLAREIPKKVKDEFPHLYDLLTDTWFGTAWNTLPIKEFKADTVTIARLIRTHESPIDNFSEGFIKLMIDAHGRGSGTEKGLLHRFTQPHKNPVYLSTSLAREIIINTKNIEEVREHLYEFLRVHIGALKMLMSDRIAKGGKLTLKEWLCVRNKLVQKIVQCFSITIAESRRPLNDVTLLDQTAISVAFFKAALAQNLLVGKWKDPSAESLADKYHWRLLRVGVDALTFWGTSNRITDLLARKELVQDALNEIQLLLEVTYPLGNEVYRDENGSIFIVPDVNDLLSYIDGSETLEKRIQSIADDKFSGETGFTWSLSNRTRDTLQLGRLAVEAFPQPKPQADWLKQQWINPRKDICPVCGLRPQGPGQKARDRKVCDTCEERRVERSKNWTDRLSTSVPAEKPETVWLDEVADVYGRLALVVAQFDLVDCVESRKVVPICFRQSLIISYPA